MHKRIEINLIDPDYDGSPLYYSGDHIIHKEPIRPQLYKHDCKNILKEAKKTNISTDELLNAIVAEMYKNNLHHMVIDIDERENHYAPAKEMTITEIEAALGHKVKIVNENK